LTNKALEFVVVDKRVEISNQNLIKDMESTIQLADVITLIK
jgi:hypothetical protein